MSRDLGSGRESKVHAFAADAVVQRATEEDR